MKTNFLCLVLLTVLSFFELKAQNSSVLLSESTFQSDFNLIFLPITIEGNDMYMILDTGAGFSVLDESVAKQLNLLIENERLMERPGGQVRLGFIKNVSFTLGKHADQMPIVTANLKEGGFNTYIGRSCAGILGFDFIQKYAFEIDYSNSKIKLFSPEGFNTKDGTKESLSILEGMPVIKGAIKHNEKSITGNWLIDTGSLMSLGLNENFYKKHLADSISPIKSLAVGFGGNTPGKMYRLDSFKISDFTFNTIISGHAEDGINDESFDGVIGGELLSRFKVIINYKNNELRLKPNKNYDKPIRWDLSGMLLVHNEKGVEVLFVYKDSPAFKKGIKPGDIIQRIDGMNAADIGLPNIWSKFHYNVGEEIVLEIKREGNIINTSIVLDDYFKNKEMD